MSSPRSEATGPATFEPVSPSDRIEVLDILRGFALLGILLMNMDVFSAPWFVAALDPPLFPGTANEVTHFVLQLGFSGKANAIFAFMFGLGLAIQMQRAAERGLSVAPMFVRRMVILFAVGISHTLLLWDGDVLRDYALLGLVLLAVRNSPDRRIIALFVVVAVFPLVRTTWSIVTHEPAMVPPEQLAAMAREHLEVYAHGSYVEQVTARYELWTLMLSMADQLRWPFVGMSFILATMLLGLMAGRKRVFPELDQNLPRIRKATLWCLGLGLGMAVIQAIGAAIMKPSTELTVAELIQFVSYNLSRLLLCVGYVGGITLLAQRPRRRSVLGVLGPAGRMPLTNYLMQSVIATTIFYSWGLGLYGTIGPALGVVFSLSIFAVQVLYSHWWFRHFRFGPLEWLWRGASYGSLPRLRAG